MINQDALDYALISLFRQPKHKTEEQREIDFILTEKFLINCPQKLKSANNCNTFKTCYYSYVEGQKDD